VKSGAEFENCAQSAIDATGSGCRFKCACDQLQERALTRTIPPDDADDFAAWDVERDIVQCPELRVALLTGEKLK
jgi:hypothetical protein